MSRKLRTFLILSLLLSFKVVSAQCAMCKAVVESGDAEMAESLNTGIIYLMAFPYILVAIAGYFIYRNWKRKKL